jgi:hypothetical protein
MFFTVNFAQSKKAKAPQDTVVSVSKRISDIDAQIMQLTQRMKLESWYDNFQQYQQNIAFLQGMKQSLSGIKDSTITIPKGQ